MYESFKTVQNSSDRFAHGADADSDARNERIRRTKKRMDNKPLFLFYISEFLRNSGRFFLEPYTKDFGRITHF